MSLLDDVKKIIMAHNNQIEEDGTVNSGDPVKAREYENKVREIVGKMSDADIDAAKEHFKSSKSIGHLIVKKEMDKEIVRRRTTKQK